MSFRSSWLFFVLGMVAYIVVTSFSPHKGTYQLKTVVIDAGHGGKDPGCSGINTKEKDVALAVALKLGKFIEQNCKGVKVIYTRTTDVFVELQERAGIANRNNADLFICIHCNANPNKEAHGAETYVMGLHKAKGNLEVAKRENSSILLEDNYKKNYGGFDPNSDEANILFIIYQNVYQQQSLDLAAKIQNYYRENANRTDKGVKQAGFLVLWKTAMPSLLTETGFLTNPDEEKFLASNTGQDFLALSIFKAFRDYKDQVEGRHHQIYNDSLDHNLTKQGPINQPTVSNPDTPSPKPIRPIGQNSNPSPSSIPPLSHSQNSAPTTTPPSSHSSNTTLAPAATLVSDTSLFLSVQIIVTDRSIPKGSSQFKGFEPITEILEQGIYKYAAGKFLKLDEAVNFQKELRKKGFPDAFLIGIQKGRKIPFLEAKKLLKLKD